MASTLDPTADDPTSRILAVDDDEGIRVVVRMTLESSGFEVWPAASGREALEVMEKRGLPHLALVDIMMPEMSGLELCGRMQEFVDLPVILLTSIDDVKTKVDAINSVADDYVVKPFQPVELVSRVRRLLRRVGDFSYTLEPRIRVDDRLAVELARRRAIVGGTAVKLTPIETKLLYLLMRGGPRTTRTDYLLRRLWPLEEVHQDSLHTHVWRLRRKIEATPGKPRYVVTRRGLGYSFGVDRSDV